MEAKELGEIEPVAKTEARVASVFHIEVLTLRRWEERSDPREFQSWLTFGLTAL